MAKWQDAPAVSGPQPWANAPPVTPNQPPPSGEGSFLDPLMQGLTAGWSDEAAGAMAYGLQSMGLNGGLGPMSPSEAYTAYRDRTRRALADYQQRHPVVSAGAEIAGAVVPTFAMPLGAVAKGAGLASQALRGAATGAGYGALYGAGASDTDRLSGAVTGGLSGGTVGAVAPVLTAPISAAASRIRGAFAPPREAASRVASARARDVAAGASILTPAQEQAALAADQPILNIDRGGETVRALARSAANTSPEGREILSSAINRRFEAQGPRTTAFIHDLVRTPANASMTRDALEEAARKSRSPFYQKAFAEGAGGIWDPDLEAMVKQSPLMLQAAKEAKASIANKMAAGRAINYMSPTGTPTLEMWDQVKRTLDSGYNVAKKAGDKEKAADIDALRKALIAKLDTAVPSYKDARGVAASLFGATDALDAGEKFVTANMAPAEVRKALSRMTTEEQTLFREGFASGLIDRVEKVGDRRNIVSQIWGNKASRDKVELALGTDNARRMETFMRVEILMDLARDVMGNSTTARQLVESGLAGGAINAGLSGNWQDPSAWVTGALLGVGARSGMRAIDQRVAQRVAQLLASDDPAVFQQGVSMMAGNGVLMEALRRATGPAAAIFGPNYPASSDKKHRQAPLR